MSKNLRTARLLLAVTFVFVAASVLVSTPPTASAYSHVKDLTTEGFTFPYYWQHYGNYCGPAVVQELLDGRRRAER